MSGDTVTYKPHAGAAGTDGFKFKVNDGKIDSNIATVMVNVLRTITVSTTGDTNACGTPCSLRGAIGVANSGDTIIIPAGTYTLTLGSELAINKNLTLAGAGSGDTILQAATGEGIANFRVFNITAGDVAIFGVTIRNGKMHGAGGGILNWGTLTLTNSTVSSNMALAGGGGILNNLGTLTLTNSTVSGNMSTNSHGGGIYNDRGTLTLTNSTVSGNTSPSGDGGGILNNGTLTLTNSTVSGNTAYNGGGIGISFARLTTLTNSTISGNEAITGDGGGILDYGTLTLTNSTVSGNRAASQGGGIVKFSGTAGLTNT